MYNRLWFDQVEFLTSDDMIYNLEDIFNDIFQIYGYYLMKYTN